jgi:hypothetical protein
MNIKSTLLLALVFNVVTPAIADVVDIANQTLLPEDTFVIYTDGRTVINHPEPGFEEKIMPTVNLYKGSPGCYIACYSHQRENAIYTADSNIYVLGQVRIAGKYSNRICEPTNYAGKEISGDATFKTICTEKVKSCAGNNCWAGGDTGGWFGLQSNH